MLITFEGGEGAGKTTQIRLLAEALRAQGQAVTVTREPGGTALGEQVRSLLLAGGMGRLAEAFLFNAARAQLMEDVIFPALTRGETVLCDRFFHSTLAYQGYGRGEDLVRLVELNRLATDGRRPDLVVLLDIEPVAGLRRKRQDAEWTRFEAEAERFHAAVRAGYLQLAGQALDAFLVLNATRPVGELHGTILSQVLRMQKG